MARHGYKLRAGTLYPMLHNLEKRDYLRFREGALGKIARRMFRATPLAPRGVGKRQAEGGRIIYGPLRRTVGRHDSRLMLIAVNQKKERRTDLSLPSDQT